MNLLYARSVYVRILIKCVSTVVFLMATAYMMSWFVKKRPTFHGAMFAQDNAFQFDSARKAYEEGGREKLAQELRRMRKFFPGRECFLTGPTGLDLVTGEDLSILLAKSEQSSPVPHPNRDQVFATLASPDGQYRFIVVAPWRLDEWSLTPYYVLILVTVTALCYSLIRDIASPVRALRQTLHRFGRGDLAARTHSKRYDEIGDLARTFDEMADRIQTLLTAERRLLQDISHELRSPLARLSLATGLLETTDRPSTAVARLRHNVERLNDLVGTLLQVTRAEGDPSSRNFEQIELRTVLDEVIEDCRLEADARGCHLNLRGTSTPTLVGDHELLRRAVENIVRNAIRYTPQGSAVDVDLVCEDSAILVSVRDYGPGVPEDLLLDIFKPFFKVDEVRQGETGGVGLGLAIAHRAIVVHSGEMTARNASPGLLVTIRLAGDGTEV